MTWRLFLAWLWLRLCSRREISLSADRSSGWEPLTESAGVQNYFLEDDPNLPPAGTFVRQMLRLANRFAPQETVKSTDSPVATAGSIPDEIYTLW